LSAPVFQKNLQNSDKYAKLFDKYIYSGGTLVDKKSRILYVKRYLETQSDEQHQVTLNDIIEYLSGEGIKAERRTVTQDIAQLEEFGADIVCNRGNPNTYFVGTCAFELPELKMLVDAVQASRVIPADKAAALIAKLTGCVSVHQASELHRQLYAYTLPDSTCKEIWRTIDTLFTAINSGTQVTFKYYEYDQHKRKQYKHGKKEYRFSPYGMLWNGERHYVVGYEDSHGGVITFRVDRIAAIKLTDKADVPAPADFDMAYYKRSVFAMYNGKLETVTLLCENAMMKSVIDQFGEGVHTEAVDAAHFTATAEVSASPTFFGWVFSFAGKVRLTAPESVVAKYRETAEKSIEGMA
jgi:predicted DNA-binding transcriptional regulator YafY